MLERLWRFATKIIQHCPPHLKYVFPRQCSNIHRVLEKNCANLFLLELRQISTNFGNFWQKDGKEAKIMQGALNFHSLNSHHHTTVLNADVPNCYTTLKVVICNKVFNDLISTQ